MVLQVYGHPKSTAARLVALICKEKEIPYEVVLVDHFKGQNKLPEHLKHQPFGQTPYIVRRTTSSSTMRRTLIHGLIDR